jgi:hypothetical protein
MAKITEDDIREIQEHYGEDAWDVLEKYTLEEKIAYLNENGHSYLEEYFYIRPGAVNMVIADKIHGLIK